VTSTPRAKRRWTEVDLAAVLAKSGTSVERAIVQELERDIAMFEPFAFELPWPPSVNRAYANTDSGRVKTAELREYVRHASGALFAQRVPTRRIAHPCEITLTQHAPTTAGDVDNGVKVILDCLKKFGVLHDDNRKIVKRVIAEDGDREEGGRVEVRISPWEKNHEHTQRR
jgi:Holliday junction resolvase RusA-like endonuclease